MSTLKKHLLAISIDLKNEPLDSSCRFCGETPESRRQRPTLGCRFCSELDEDGWSEEYKAFLDSKPVEWFRERYLASLKKS